MVEKSIIQKMKKPSISKKTITKPKSKEDRYVIRKIKGKFKVIKFDPSKMKLRRIALDVNNEHVESTYTKAEVEKLRKENDDIK